MRTLVVDHPLVAHKLTTLRDENTDTPTFRRLTEELVTLLAYEATRDVRVHPTEVITPVAPTRGVTLTPRPLVVPILRAGLGMLEGMLRLLPTAEVGFLGMVRNEETLEASTYAERLPDDLSGRQCYLLDPMLATGGTLAAAVRFLTAPITSPRSVCSPPQKAARALSPSWPISRRRSRSLPPLWTRG
jgi:uracil phosphoribosyltransferase